MSKEIAMWPIGYVRGGRAAASDDAWDDVEAVIELDPAQFGPDSTAGLAEFSYIEVLYHLHGVPAAEIVTGARHPRGNPDWPKVGVFAQRCKKRPNRIGATICRLERVEGTRIFVRGLDAIDGTPVLDIKPVTSGHLPRGDLREPKWAAELMKGYW